MWVTLTLNISVSHVCYGSEEDGDYRNVYASYMSRTCFRIMTFLSFLQSHSDQVIVVCTSRSSVLTGSANSWFCNVLIWWKAPEQLLNGPGGEIFAVSRTIFELLSRRGREVIQDLRGEKKPVCTSTTGPTPPADEEHVTWRTAPEPDLKVWAFYLVEQILVFPEEQIRRKFARDKWWILQKAITLNLSNPA